MSYFTTNHIGPSAVLFMRIASHQDAYSSVPYNKEPYLVLRFHMNEKLSDNFMKKWGQRPPSAVQRLINDPATELT